MGFRQTHLLKDVSDDGGPSRVEDTNAELARQAHLWKKLHSTQIKELKKEHDTQVCIGSKNHAETTTSLGNEKADKNALQVEIEH